MIRAGYIAHLTCDNTPAHLRDDPSAHEFAGDTKAEVMRDIRAAGWAVGRDQLCLCPACAKALNGRPSAKASAGEQVADAEARSAGWLGIYNEYNERGLGKTAAAQAALRKSQFWLDRANKLRGWGG